MMALGLSACQAAGGERATEGGESSPVAAKLAQYTPVKLTADLSGLSERERRMLPLLIAAAQEMDTIYWRQIYQPRDSLLQTISDAGLRRFVLINYGPWDRLDGNRPFVPGVGPRPPGAEFYPRDMTKEEFERAAGASPETASTPWCAAIRAGRSGPCRITRPSPSRPAAPPRGCARRPRSRTTPRFAAKSSSPN